MTAQTTPQPSQELSYDTKVIIVILCLFFFWPVGVVLMWLWMKTWPVWVKILITLPIILAVLFAFTIVAVIFLVIFFGHHRGIEYDDYDRYPPIEQRWDESQYEMDDMWATSSATPIATVKPATAPAKLRVTATPQAR